MEVGTLASGASNQNVGISVMKKAIKLQEDQMQTLLESAGATSNSGTKSSSDIAATHLGVGVNLNIAG